MLLGCFCTVFAGISVYLYEKKRRLATLLLVLVLAFSFFCPGMANASENVEMNITVDGVSRKYSAQKIKLLINGVEQEKLEIPPIEIDGGIYLPAADTLLALGAVATWNAVAGDMLVNFQGRLMILSLNSDSANIDARKIPMPAPSKLVNGKMMVPLSFFNETISLSVNWDSINRIVYIWDNAKLSSTNQTPAPGNATHQPVLPGVGSTDSSNYDENIPASIIIERANDVSTAPIPSADYPATKITSIQVSPEGNDFLIVAASEISSVDKNVLTDGRIIIDIYNAEFNLDAKEFPVDHPNVEQVRAAQNQIKPELITRIVFDVKAASDFSVSLSADRKTLIVSFKKNAVQDIQFSTDGINDTLTLTTQSHAILNVYPLSDPLRIIIDTPNADLHKVMSENINGKFVKSVRSEIIEPRTARITLELKQNASFELFGLGNTTQVVIFEPTYKNIAYDIATQTIKLEKPSGVLFDVNAITISDEYNDLRYNITFPVSFERTIGHGEYIIKDEYLHSIIVNNIDGHTRITLYEKQILAATIMEDSTYIYIKLLKPKQKYDRIVVLDPGHGGRDPGVPGTVIHEKVITLDIVKKAITLLERDGSVKVYSTRLTDVYPDLYERAAFADAIGDLFVSVHVNSAEGLPSANGTEVHYLTHDNDGYIGIKSKDVAEIMLKHLLSKLGTRDRKTKETNYVVLKNSVPSVLLEVGFLTNPAEEQNLISDQFQSQAAEAIYLGILEVFNTYKPRR